MQLLRNSAILIFTGNICNIFTSRLGNGSSRGVVVLVVLVVAPVVLRMPYASTFSNKSVHGHTGHADAETKE